MEIRLLRPSEVTLAGAHVVRHAAESGRDGDQVFVPFSELDREAFESSRYDTWRRSLLDQGWERFWAAIDRGQVVGHVELSGPSLSSALHRARLSIGVERPHRGQGLGGRLLEVALGWARAQERLCWVDLSVFAHNMGARRLYLRHGFVETGHSPDAFRVDDKSIDDVLMTQWVGPPRG